MAGGRLVVKGTKVPREETKHDAKALLVLRVEDDGVGFPAAHEERTGLGNLRQRLAAIYGDAASVTIEKVERGAAVTVSVPYEEAGARTGR